MKWLDGVDQDAPVYVDAGSCLTSVAAHRRTDCDRLFASVISMPTSVPDVG